MPNVRVLPETVQNKIAAGEVIERPASVVKELAENAMDAGATLVAVEMEEGGHRLIRVSDDGSGMDEADLLASLQRHATSKIRDVDDIFGIHTFGFRGEALPSIGSVSRMRVATALAGETEGREIEIEGGKILRLSPAPPRRGTMVEVRDIFFNTPARRKFLRQPSSENTRANEIVTRLALGNPGIGFRLQTGERLTLSVKPAATQLERIAEIFGRDLADRLVPFSRDVAEGLAVSGHFARPPKSFRNSKGIYVLVNRRWIRYYGLARAAADVFQGILPPREYPFAVINLEVDPARVDLNVHPTKEEVRFEREEILISGVRRALREALEGIASQATVAGLAPASRAGDAPPPSAPPPPAERRQAYLDFPSRRENGSGWANADLRAIRERVRGGGDPAPPEPAFAPPAPADGGGAVRDPDAGARSPAEAGGGEFPPDDRALGPEGGYRVLGQAGGKYIIVDSPDGLLLVDPHALHERWNFDRLVEERKRGVASARLLLPLEFDLSPMEAAAADEAVPALAEYGFDVALPATNRLRVTAAPSYVPPAKLENLLRQILADLGEAEEAMAAARERLLASLACRSSVLLGRNLPEEEMLSLLDRFFNRGQLPTCPHGRPTAIKIDWNELARRFGR